MAEDQSVARGRAWVVLSYAVAAFIAWLVVRLPLEMSPWGWVVAADITATFVIFGFSRALRNSSIYDPYWSVAPMAMVVWWWQHPNSTMIVGNR